MDQSAYNRLKMYLMPTGGLFLTVIGVLLEGAVIFALLIGAAKAAAVAIVSVCSGIMIFAGIYDFVAFNRLLKRIRRNNELPVMTADFIGGKKYLNGELILGNTWAIGRHCGYPVKYSDVESAYIMIVRNKGTEAARNLMVKTKYDKAPRVLCQLKHKKKGSDDLLDVFLFMNSKNSQIKFPQHEALQIAAIKRSNEDDLL